MKAKILKPVLLVLTAVLLVVASVLGTMAYMTSSSAVSNVFTVGNVTINMTETKVDSDGVPLTDTNNRGDGNSYLLSPANSYLKDPLITVSASSQESYLFVRMRNDLKTIECTGFDGVDEHGDPIPCKHVVDSEGNMRGYDDASKYSHSTMLQQLIANGWQEIERAESNVDAVFVFVGKGNAFDVNDPANAGRAKPDAALVGGSGAEEEYEVFNNFTLACEVPNLDIFGGARVALVAYAIQADLNDGTESGSAVGYENAWKYIKDELPFVV